MAIKIRRGLEADRTSITPEQGELIYTTDGLELYIGDGVTAGGNRIGPGASWFVGPPPPPGGTGVNGDFYLADDGDVYEKVAGVWVNTLVNLTGPQGPAGADGADGADGLDINWLGAYNNATSYVINDAVSYLGSSYICILASTGNLPTNATYWNLMAQKGDTGAVGQGVPVGGTAGQVLAKIDGTDYNTEWTDVEGGVNGKSGGDPKIIVIESHFTSSSIDTDFSQEYSGTGTGASQLHSYDHPGQFFPSPGTASGANSGQCTLRHQIGTFAPRAGDTEFVIKLKTPTTTMDATEDYRIRVGFFYSYFSGNSNSIFIGVRYNENGGRWYLSYNAGGVNQFLIDSGVAYASNTWITLKFTVNKTTQECKFYIDGVLVGTNTPATLIGATSAEVFSFILSKMASAGAAPRPAIDYWYFKQVLT